MTQRVSKSRRAAGWAMWALLATAWAGFQPASAQVAPEGSAKRLKPAEGLEARLWASEPLLSNPTTMEVDSRGRVWVAEGLNYRLTRGGNRKFHRIEEADRIKILEDTDGDGKADKMTVFADRIFPVPMGMAIEEHYDKDGKYRGCRVFIGNSPDLLVLEDTDGDDRADRRYPLLTGFGGVDSDHGVHGMALGLDGKLYFTHGDGCCSVQHDHSERPQNFDVVDKSGRHVWTDQLANTLRVERDGTEFEIVCDRQRNNYETCFNSFGNLFTSDNDDDGHRGCRVIWAMDGGHYGYRTPGSPRHWGEEVPGNVPKIVGTGNGSPCGIMVYEGDLLPKEYLGGLLEVDAGTRQVNFFPIARQGAAFRTDYKVFLGSDDPWFRPVDACAAPDGSIFVADWYDAGVGGHAFSDQTTGRIYRVAPRGAAPYSKRPRPDFATVDGLITALKSPNAVTIDVARRLLIERGKETAVMSSIGDLALNGFDPVLRARALWVWRAIAGDGAIVPLLNDPIGRNEPRIREMVVRMLGRDCRENGHVEYKNSEAKKPPAALKFLDALLAMAGDADAGVRRELILAVRNLPTEKIGAALRKLTAAWDGQDRWYLEALGLALEKRDEKFLATLFDGSLYGDLDLGRAGDDGDVALPPYYPVDRNEAYPRVGEPERRTTALSKSLGLAWRLHGRGALAFLEKMFRSLRANELRQAAIDVLDRAGSIEAGELAVRLAARKDGDPARRAALFALLKRHIDDDWKALRDRPAFVKLVKEAISRPETLDLGLPLAVATADDRFRDVLKAIAGDPKLPEDERAEAIAVLGSFKPEQGGLLDRSLDAARGRKSAGPIALAAARALARHAEARPRLAKLLVEAQWPIELRREALRALAEYRDGGDKILKLVRSKKLPDDLKAEAAALLYAAADRQTRDEAARALPLPKRAGGHALLPIGELVKRGGDAERGRAVFFRNGSNACGSCHRVQGRGRWVGPDLSTIGTKYGRLELVRSIVSPSAAIGHGFRSVVVALDDGRVLTGLPVEDTEKSLVLKTADGRRVALGADAIEERRSSDVSLMPEGLAQTMTDQELIDLLVYLTTLRKPVSIVGQCQVAGPLIEEAGAAGPAIDPSALASGATADGGRNGPAAWRRATADAEGRIDLSVDLPGAARPNTVFYVRVPLGSPRAQSARIVLDTALDVQAWLDGEKRVALDDGRAAGGPKTATVELPKGRGTLILRLSSGPSAERDAALVVSIVADEPVSFLEK